ncbi:MAG: HEAT repeat domain-containing protein [Pyrinomonadaceae bacterium]
MAGDNSNNHHLLSSPGAQTPSRPRSPWPLAVVAALFIVLPFLSWYGTSFWRPLNDDEIEKYLSDEQKPRHVQHALEQIDRRIVKKEVEVRKWYPRIIALAGNSPTDIRLAAAWVMGDDNTAEEFHTALLRLLDDPDPAVRRMAALSLSRFGDRNSRPELLSMLRPYYLEIEEGGTLETVLPVRSLLSRGSLVARVRDEKGRVHEVRAPVAGKIERVAMSVGASLNAGDALLLLAPDARNVWEALRGLHLVGEMEDLPEVERYAQGMAGMSEETKKQANRTAAAIRSRAGGK